MQLSGYSLDRLCDDGEFILYRAHAKPTELPPVLLLAPASAQPRDTQEDRSRILIEERAGLGLGGAALALSSLRIPAESSPGGEVSRPFN